MKRLAEEKLEQWIKKRRRKPLIIRGARQVGKSTLVRQFAKNQKLELLEINLEKYPQFEKIFSSFDVDLISKELETHLGKRILKNTLLFLDEIQTTPAAIAALRYFYEEKPEIPIIAAGSLLEFTLNDFPYSMPVGRIEYLQLGPMNFLEYLIAQKNDLLIENMEKYQLGDNFSELTHNKLLERLREFYFLGGMPECLLTYLEEKSFIAAREIQTAIIQTYQEDFNKYKGKFNTGLMQNIFQKVVGNLGQKVKYSQLSSEHRAKEIRSIIELFHLARLFIPSYHTHCSGLPLRAGINEKIFKLFFLDIGLNHQMLGLDWNNFSQLSHDQLINRGSMAEQFIAQHLIYRDSSSNENHLYYWLREGRASNAEVDFVISAKNQIIPIKVKASKSGSLKSLQQFIYEKKGHTALRFDLNLPSIQRINHQLRQKESLVEIDFDLISLPIYFIAHPDLESFIMNNKAK